MPEWQVNTTEDYEHVSADKFDVPTDGVLRFYDKEIVDDTAMWQFTIVAVFAKGHWLSVQPDEPGDE